MSNRQKLKDLVIDTFLLDPAEFSFELRRDEVETWDSLGVVSIAVGVEQTFGYHFTPDEALALRGVQDIVSTLSARGVSFDE